MPRASPYVYKSSKNPKLVSDFAKQTVTTLSLITKEVPHAFVNVNKKWAIWTKLLRLPQYIELATTPLSEVLSAPSVEDHKGVSLGPSVHSIERMSEGLYLSEEEMVDFLVEYLEFVGTHYPAQSELFKQVLVNLKAMSDFYEEGATRSAQDLRRQTIELVRRELERVQRFTGSLSEETALIALMRSSTPEKQARTK